MAFELCSGAEFEFDNTGIGKFGIKAVDAEFRNAVINFNIRFFEKSEIVLFRINLRKRIQECESENK
jgi:hypothetical protein